MANARGKIKLKFMAKSKGEKVQDVLGNSVRRRGRVHGKLLGAGLKSQRGEGVLGGNWEPGSLTARKH